MSLNSVTAFSPEGTPILAQQDEIIVKTVESVAFSVTDSPKKLEGRGKVYLTDLKLILVPEKPTEAFKSLAVPHTALLAFKQENASMFSPHRLHLTFKPHPDGRLGDTPCSLQFQFNKNEKEVFHGFAGAYDKTRERAVAKIRANLEDEVDLPAYTDNGVGSSSAKPGAEAESTVPYDAPPGYDA